MDFLARLFKPRPWQALEKNFKLQLNCEECGIGTPTLAVAGDLLCCKECEEAHNRRARFLHEEAEWEESSKDS